jgi:hypothetical protein
MRSSQNSVPANFGEFLKAEVQLRKINLPRGWVNHTPTDATLVRLVFPFAAFHPIVLIDVADVEPASTAQRVGRLPVAGAVQDVIVGPAVERVGGSIPPEFVTSFAPAHRVGAGTPYSFVLPGATRTRSRPLPPYSPASGPSPP